MFAFDVAYEMGKERITELLGQKVAQFKVDASKRSPRHPFFARPQMVVLPPMEWKGPQGAVAVQRAVKILPIGAISITISVPFAVDSLTELVPMHDLDLGERTLHQEVRCLAERVYSELRPYMRPLEYLPEEEAYTVFCLETGPALGEVTDAERWLEESQREVAALLTQESEVGLLSDQEAAESTCRYLSYYRNDLVVLDWDAALLIDEPDDFAEALYVLELANLNLAELEAYDRLLDRALERSYRDMRDRSYRGRRETLHELRELRIDMARYNDELNNITKFFGDWHLARVYEAISGRFHLPQWNKNIESKLQTLDNIYQLLQHDQSNRWMLILETTIVLLFIIDLVILFTGSK
jgi:hypothetical protein